jgi:hypothetical protein
MKAGVVRKSTLTGIPQPLKIYGKQIDIRIQFFKYKIKKDIIWPYPLKGLPPPFVRYTGTQTTPLINFIFLKRKRGAAIRV